MMKTIWLALVGMVFSFGMKAQTAVDFTVTDIYGEEHALYDDYLDQDKILVLGFFYVGAPMIDQLFPAVEGLAYELWQNQIPCDFLLMSNINQDQELLTFAEEHSLSLPIAGEQGGSADAMVPYVDGTYGPFYGYPMFVVIGPEGQVIYDPWGDEMADILDSLHGAIDEAGAPVSVASIEALVEPNILPIAEGVQLEVPSEWEGGSLGVYAVDGKLIKRTLLVTGRTVIPIQESGLLIYSIDHRRGIRTGKFLR